MADRGVREQPLDVGLHDGEERTDEQREQRQHPHDRTPIVAVERQRHDEHADHRRERRGLADRCHERRHRCRGALVHVRCPHVERGGRHLEAEADHQQCDARHRQRLVVEWCHRALEHAHDLADVGRARGAVDEGDAVEEERRREATEHEVLDARLGALATATIARCQDVQRERQRLQAEEQHDEIIGRGHHDGADGGDEVQRVDLRTVVRGPAKVARPTATTRAARRHRS